MKEDEFVVVDLFAGCGGLSKGFENAGFNIAAAVDNWEPAIKVYKKNFDHEILNMDLSDVKRTVETLKSYRPSIVIGGPPCQDFSQAGKRNEDLGRGNLTIVFAKIVESLKPRLFVMENVDQLTNTRKFVEAVKIFKASGYGLTIKLIDASLCGIPQKRKRFFVIGALMEKDHFLDVILQDRMAKKPTTLREYFKDNLDFEFYYRHPRTYERRAIFHINEPSPTIRGVNRPIPKNYKVHKNDATKDLSKVRPLTTLERALIQTFPKDFIFEGNKTELEQLIGNAVPVKLAEFMALRIKEYLKNKQILEKIWSAQNSGIESPLRA